MYRSNSRYTKHVRYAMKSSGDSAFATRSVSTGHSKGTIGKPEMNTSINGKLENKYSSHPTQEER